LWYIKCEQQPSNVTETVSSSGTSNIIQITPQIFKILLASIKENINMGPIKPQQKYIAAA
jgi:hypothetical protein